MPTTEQQKREEDRRKCKDLAEMIRMVYSALLEQGFDEQQSYQLTRDVFGSHITLMGRK